MRKNEKMIQLKHSEISEEEGMMSKWSKQVPEDMMQLILQRLCIANYVGCRAVCLSWQAYVDMEIASKRSCPTPELPWLMVNSHAYSLKDDCFWSPSTDKIYKSSEARRRRCVGSIEGWLAMVDSDYLRPEGFVTSPWTSFRSQNYTTINYFLNPISCAKVMLPSQSTIPRKGSCIPFFLDKLVSSSSPTDSQPCLVAALCARGRYLAFSRSTHKSWILIHWREYRGLIFEDIEIIDGKLYAATSAASEFLMVFDIQDGRSYQAQNLVILQPRIVYPIPDNTHRTCLAKDPTSKQLFMILANHEVFQFLWSIIRGRGHDIPPKTRGFRVFKLDMNGPRWIQVHNLGDRILFLSKASNIFISASSSLEGNNCIYFAFDNPCFASPSMGRDFGVFSLESTNIKPLVLPDAHSRTRLHTHTVWFTPNLW